MTKYLEIAAAFDKAAIAIAPTTFGGVNIEFMMSHANDPYNQFSHSSKAREQELRDSETSKILAIIANVYRGLAKEE